MTKIRKAYGFALIATLCWSTVATAFEKGLDKFNHDVPALLGWSVFMAVLFLFVVSLFPKKQIIRVSLSPRMIINSAILGALNPFLYYLILLKAYDLLPPSEAQPLNYTWPVTLSLMSALIFRQRIHIFQIIAMAVALAGVIIILTRGHLSWHISNAKGVALAVGSSFIWAIYWIFNLKDPRPALPKMKLNFLFGLIYLALFLFLKHDISLPSYSGIICALWIGLCEMGLSFVIWMWALESAPTASTISHVVYLSPFISFIFIRLFLERIGMHSVIGLCLIIGGVLIGSMPSLLNVTKK